MLIVDWQWTFHMGPAEPGENQRRSEMSIWEIRDKIIYPACLLASAYSFMASEYIGLAMECMLHATNSSFRLVVSFACANI